MNAHIAPFMFDNSVVFLSDKNVNLKLYGNRKCNKVVKFNVTTKASAVDKA